MLNRFAALCSRCENLVQADGDVLDRIDGKLIVRHDYRADSDRTAARYAALRPGQEQEPPCRPQ